jgi:hypothetical protein
MVTRLFYLGAAAASLTKAALAFTPSAPDLIKKAGSGVSIKAPGDLSLFDPNEDGKLQGTNNLLERVSNGAAFAIVPPQNIVDAPPAGVTIGDAQHFLEHLDSNGELPLNFAKPQSPVTATVLGRARLISDDAPGDIEHIIMKLPAGFHYVEGERTLFFPISIVRIHKELVCKNAFPITGRPSQLLFHAHGWPLFECDREGVGTEKCR